MIGIKGEGTQGKPKIHQFCPGTRELMEISRIYQITHSKEVVLLGDQNDSTGREVLAEDSGISSYGPTQSDQSISSKVVGGWAMKIGKCYAVVLV